MNKNKLRSTLSYWLVLFVMFPLLSFAKQPPIEFVVMIPSYNNAKWCKQNLESVFAQTYPHWKIHYINDVSTDNTGQLVEEYIKERGMQHKCTVIHNKTRQGAMANWYYNVHKYPAKTIIVNLDGDDFLYNDRVLETLAKIYKNPRVWMTYGSYVTHPGNIRGKKSAKLPKEVIKKRRFREHPWRTSHLRTFYAGLFQKIKKKDFEYNGKFLETTCDLAMMFPMLEMASQGHIYFVEKLMYRYNTINPIGDCRAKRKMQAARDRYLRRKSRYRPLKKLFANTPQKEKQSRAA